MITLTRFETDLEMYIEVTEYLLELYWQTSPNIKLISYNICGNIFNINFAYN